MMVLNFNNNECKKPSIFRDMYVLGLKNSNLCDIRSEVHVTNAVVLSLCGLVPGQVTRPMANGQRWCWAPVKGMLKGTVYHYLFFMAVQPKKIVIYGII